MSALSHLLPYVLFVAIGLAAPVLPAAVHPWLDAVRCVAAGAALLLFARRRAYPELRSTVPPFGVRRATLLALGSGLAVGLLWVPLADAVPLMGSRGGFDTEAPLYGLRIGLRLVASILVVPFAEELLVRSFVPRFVDANDDEHERSWRDLPVGVFTPLSFAVSVGFFMLTHPEWLAALVTGVLWTLVLIRTQRLRDIVLAHAVANAILDGWVLWQEDWMWW